MTILKTLLANAKEKFDLTEPGDQESLYTLTEALLEMHELTIDALQDSARQLDTPLNPSQRCRLLLSTLLLNRPRLHKDR